MEKIKEFFSLLLLRFAVTYRNTSEYFKVVHSYYSNRDFARVDFYLLRAYLTRNPYRIAKKYLKEKGADAIQDYGETPLTTLEKIVNECGCTADDVVYEIGSGRGRSCFWLHYFVGCKVVGVECVPDFVHMAQHVRNRFEIKNMKFLFSDMLEVDYSDATVVYFYGTTAEDSLVEKLIEKLKALKPGTKVITVSYPLTDYQKEPLFKVVKSFPAQFTWGEAEVFLHVKEGKTQT